jgi:ribose 5-phosphate isomerase A
MLIDDPYAVAGKLDTITGVVEHGLFLDMANLALIAGKQRVFERTI